ncbi:hypothetical protein SASPL_151559 [Salvia splendens]|uniref:Uncharacterized protein n=1 Tax=Salvia splendens TaxID=180675 RepID=A0A8X8W8N9_SALSN|nr:uncharacterized protein LOC121783022 [Salvia splendens]KAG6390080.1 hypothetical protein SASPL_151559 [Salvia splendens]
MASEAAHDNPDEWELINDDGFVYKRKKRPRLEPSAAAPPPADPAAERKHRLERRKRALLKLKERYLEEIGRWELLSNTLTAMEQNATKQSMELPTTSSDGASSSGDISAADSSRRRLVGDLLAQVEAQEAIIRDVSSLCDIAEGLCSAQEGRFKQKLIDLPIWDPLPDELMKALGDG